MSVNNVGHMTIKEYLAKLVNLDYAGQRQLVLEWSGYHSPMLATALAVLDVQGIMKYVDAIVRQGDVWLPEQRRVMTARETTSHMPAGDIDEEWGFCRLIAYVSLLNNMARDFTLGHDRIVMTLESDSKDPESELYQMTQAAFGAEHEVTPHQIARMLVAAAQDPSEHVYAIFKDQFDRLALIVEAAEEQELDGEPILVYSNSKFTITFYGEYIETTHESGDVYTAIQEVVIEDEDSEDAQG